jgi:TRAP-type C4-dicarboxylate transport system substrate-binding protein
MTSYAVRSIPLGLLVLALACSPRAEAQTKLVYSTYIPETYSVAACDTFFMDEVTKRTSGKIVFERYHASALLNAVDTVPGIGRGAADFGNGAPGAYNRPQFPISNFVMPWITDNFVAATLAANELYAENKDFQAEYEKQNVKLLYAVIPPPHSFWSRAPIRSGSDFKGKRTRSVLAIGDAVAKLGGTPVAMAFPDGLEAISRGAIDAFGNAPFDLGVTSGLYKIAKYVTDAGRMGTFALQTSVFSLKRWNGLPPEVQQVMTDVIKEVPKCFFDIAHRDIQKAVETLGESKQNEVIVFSADEAAKLRDTTGKLLWQEWVTLVGKQGYDGQKLLGRYRELVAKYEKDHPTKNPFELYLEKYAK